MSILFKVILRMGALLPFLAAQCCEKRASASRTVSSKEGREIIDSIQVTQVIIKRISENKSWPRNAVAVAREMPIDPNNVKLSVRGDIFKSDLEGIKRSLKEEFTTSGLTSIEVVITYNVEDQLWVMQEKFKLTK